MGTRPGAPESSDDIEVISSKQGDIVLVGAKDWTTEHTLKRRRTTSFKVNDVKTSELFLLEDLQAQQYSQDADLELALKLHKQELAEFEVSRGSSTAGSITLEVVKPESLLSSNAVYAPVPSATIIKQEDVIDLSGDEKPFDLDLETAEALQLQELIASEPDLVDITGSLVGKPTKRAPTSLPTSSPPSQSIDLDPNVFNLEQRYKQYDVQFFDGMLQAFRVTVMWSKQMTLCAGICYFKPKLDSCIVRLSQPLLKLRPISDSVDTLIHEMIHAYCFVTGSSQGRDGHGDDFQKHMHRINRIAGTHITVYHSFHDEVRHYKKHVWRCNGVCRNKHPYYGWVRRAMNRKPQKADSWFAEHERSCGGEFTKVAGPDLDKKKEQEKKGMSKFLNKCGGPADKANVKGKGKLVRSKSTGESGQMSPRAHLKSTSGSPSSGTGKTPR